jgi:hypothetical protein
VAIDRAIGATASGQDWQQELARLVEDYRDRCLWFLRPDFMPTTTEQILRTLEQILRTLEQILRTLEQIERGGDRAAYERAEKIRRWLQAPSSA